MKITWEEEEKKGKIENRRPDGVELIAKMLISPPDEFNEKDIRDIRYGFLSYQISVALEIIKEYKVGIDLAVIEKPVYQKSKKGKDAAKKGGINQLLLAAGSIIGNIASRGYSYSLITPHQWKIGTPPMAIEKNIKMLFPNVEWKSFDEIEAAALAIWAWRNNGRYPIFRPEKYSIISSKS